LTACSCTPSSTHLAVGPFEFSTFVFIGVGNTTFLVIFLLAYLDGYDDVEDDFEKANHSDLREALLSAVSTPGGSTDLRKWRASSGRSPFSSRSSRKGVHCDGFGMDDVEDDESLAQPPAQQSTMSPRDLVTSKKAPDEDPDPSAMSQAAAFAAQGQQDTEKPVIQTAPAQQHVVTTSFDAAPPIDAQAAVDSASKKVTTSFGAAPPIDAQAAVDSASKKASDGVVPHTDAPKAGVLDAPSRQQTGAAPSHTEPKKLQAKLKVPSNSSASVPITEESHTSQVVVDVAVARNGPWCSCRPCA